MPDIVTRGTKTTELDYQEGDEQIAETQLEVTSTPVTLDETHNREHIICGSGSDVINFTATATLKAALDTTQTGSETIGWIVKISNNSGSDVTLNATSIQFNGGTGTLVVADNDSVIVSFDSVSGTEGYFVVGEHVQVLPVARGGTGAAAASDIEIDNHAYFASEVDNGNSGATDTIDWTAGNKQKSTLTANCTYTFSPAPLGPTNLVLRLIQDVGGTNTATWPATVHWTGGVAPTITATGNAVDIVSFYYDGTNYHGGVLPDSK